MSPFPFASGLQSPISSLTRILSPGSSLPSVIIGSGSLPSTEWPFTFSSLLILSSSVGFVSISSVGLEVSSSAFFVVDALVFGFGGAFDMAAALAAATLSAAAVGLTAVEDVAALVTVAEVVLFSPGPLLVLVGPLEDVVCLNEDEEVRLLVNLDAAGLPFLASSPVFAAVAVLLGLEAVTPGLDTLEAGRGLLLEAELALEVCLETPGVAETVLFDGRVEEAGRRAGILSLVSVLGLLRSVLGTAGFLEAESGFEGMGFLSKGLAPTDFGVCLLTPVEVAEDVLEPDLVDLASSTALTPGLGLPAAEAEVGLVDVILLATVDAGLVEAAVLAGVGLVGLSSFLTGADFARTELGALTLALAAGPDLDPGVAFLVGDPCVAFLMGEVGVSDFFSVFEDVSGGFSDSSFEGLTSSATSSVLESFRGDGSGERSLTGVAGVTASSGILRLATPSVTGATGSVSGSDTWSGVNWANSSPPFCPGVFSMNPSGSLLSNVTISWG